MRIFFISILAFSLITSCSSKNEETNPLVKDKCEERFKKLATEQEKAYYSKYGKWSREYQLMIDKCNSLD